MKVCFHKKCTKWANILMPSNQKTKYTFTQITRCDLSIQLSVESTKTYSRNFLKSINCPNVLFFSCDGFQRLRLTK